MSRVHIVLVLSVVFLAPLVAADSDNSGPKINSIGVMGQGIAVSANDPASFELVSVGVAKIAHGSSDNQTITRAGIFFFGQQKFTMKNIAIGNDSISASLFSQNESAGSLKLALVAKPGKDVWFGSLVIGTDNYNLYIVGARRADDNVEAAGKIRQLCMDKPEGCMQFKNESGIGNTCDNLNSTNCRDKIKDFCEKNPQDARCKAVHNTYCADHLDDSRCRQSLNEYCNKDENSTAACQRLYGTFRQMMEPKEDGRMKDMLEQRKKMMDNQASDLKERLKKRAGMSDSDSGQSGEDS